MAMTLHVDIVSAEQELFSGLAEAIFATGELGELEVTPGHSQLLTALKPGQVKVKLANDGIESFYISGGVLEVQPWMVTVLADTVIRAKDIDEVQAEEAYRNAQKQLESKQAELDYAEALTSLAEAAAQLKAIQDLRKRGK